MPQSHRQPPALPQSELHAGCTAVGARVVVVGGWDGAGAGAEVGPAVEGGEVGAGEGVAGHQNGVSKVPPKHIDWL